jgi:AmmeMemoRadiSam system protein A
MLSQPSRGLLLTIARSAIEDRLHGRAPAPLAGLPDDLQRPSGAFVTLRRRADRELRGCIGYVEPRYPLAQAVALAAVSAAVSDSRFDPVLPAELAQLALDISVLGPTFPIAPHDVKVGLHGLVVENGSCRGLLLPQVAIEWGWDAPSFLEQTCRKAGLAKDAWRAPETLLLAFEAVVVEEP